jgi:hypothetical protein
MSTRLLKFIAGPELGIVTTVIFVGLYAWPLVTSDKPSATFHFIFCVWCIHVACLAASCRASRRLDILERPDGNDPGSASP